MSGKRRDEVAPASNRHFVPHSFSSSFTSFLSSFQDLHTFLLRTERDPCPKPDISKSHGGPKQERIYLDERFLCDQNLLPKDSP